MIRPARGRVLVRPVETDETLPGGRIVIPSESRERLASHQVRIEAVGEPDICEDPGSCVRQHAHDTHPTNPAITPGAWAIVTPRSFVDAGSVDGKLYFVRIADIQAVFLTEGHT